MAEGAHHEDVGRVGAGTADVEELEEVPKLAVDVAADGDGGLNGLDVGLLHEPGANDEAEMLHGRLGEMAALAQLGEVQIWVEVAHE